MSRWPVVRLGAIAEIISGQSPSGETYNEEGDGLPFFQGKAEFGKVSPTPRKWCSSPTKIAQQDDILISVRAPVGPTNIAAVQCCIGRGLAAMRINSDLTSTGALHEATTHSTIAHLTGIKLKRLMIPAPPISLQQTFAAHVADLHALIILQERHLAQAEALLQSLMARFFSGSLECADMSAHSKEPIESAVVLAHPKTTTPRRRFDSAGQGIGARESRVGARQHFFG